MKKIIIAIDGYSACGKSTTAKAVSRIFGFKYIDSGAMYRAVTYFFTENHISISNPHEVTKALKSFKVEFPSDNGNNNIYLNGLNVEEKIKKFSEVWAEKKGSSWMEEILEQLFSPRQNLKYL